MIYFISTCLSTTIPLPKEVKVLNSLDKVIEDLKNIKEIALDCETTGLSPIKDKLIMLQLGTRENQYIIDTRYIDPSPLRYILEDKTKTFIGHNIKFDYNMLKQFNIVLRNVYDTMLSDRVLYNGKYSDTFIRETKRYSLAGVYKYYFNKQIEKDPAKEFLIIGKRPFTYRQILYGANDVIYTLEIKDKQQIYIDTYKLDKKVSLENKVTLAIGDQEYNGMPFKEKKWKIAIENYLPKVKESEKKLDFLVLQQEKGKKYKVMAKQQSLFGEEYESDKDTIINWNSDQQVYEVLTTVFNIYPVDKHKNPSSGADAIKLLDNSYEITNEILKYREHQKIISSFGQKFIDEHLTEDSRIRTTYNQIVDTGRMSSRNPNQQQIPSNTGYHREAFEATEGKMLSICDYSGQESRVMSDLANDTDYIKFFNEDGGDSHSFVATKMFSAAFGHEFIVTKDNENKEYRQKGKILNFFISFGGSAYTLSKTLKIPEEEAQTLIDSFYKAFPKLKEFFEKCKSFGVEKGYIRVNNVDNGIRWFPEWRKYLELSTKRHKTKEEHSEIQKIKGSIERKSMNTPIQGTASSMTKTALILFRDQLLKEGILPLKNAPVKLCATIHDETVIEADENIIKKWSKIQQECMENAGSIFCKKVKIIAEPVISKHWTH